MKVSIWISSIWVVSLGFLVTAPEQVARADSFWALQEDGQLLIVDPANGQRTNVTQLRWAPFAGLTSGDGSVWALQTDGLVWRVDPASRQQTAVASLRSPPFSGLAYGDGFLWAIQENGVVWRVDPVTGQQTGVAWLKWWPPFGGLTYGDGALWALQKDGLIWQVDPATGRQKGIASLRQPPFAGLAYGDGSLWALEGDGAVWQIDPTTGHLTAIGLLREPPFVGISYRSAGGQDARVTISWTAPEPDSDGDGLPDWWESHYFGSATKAVAGADGDADGFNNEQEWTALTCPTNGLDYLRIETCRSVPGGVSLAWQSHTGRSYSVWASSDLLSWTEHQQAMGTGGIMAYTNSAADPCVFFKLAVERLPIDQ